MTTRTTTPATTAPDFNDSEWNTVSEGAGLSVKLEVGDEFIGVYTSRETIDATVRGEEKEWDQLHFEGISPAQVAGEHCVIAPGYQLTKAFEKITPGETVKIKRLPDVDVNAPQPMQDFKVWTRK
jgi:hypothetical protein